MARSQADAAARPAAPSAHRSVARPRDHRTCEKAARAAGWAEPLAAALRLARMSAAPAAVRGRWRPGIANRWLAAPAVRRRAAATARAAQQQRAAPAAVPAARRV